MTGVQTCALPICRHGEVVLLHLTALVRWRRRQAHVEPLVRAALPTDVGMNPPRAFRVSRPLLRLAGIAGAISTAGMATAGVGAPETSTPKHLRAVALDL